jgi:ketosteroid isomerase-like protein
LGLLSDTQMLDTTFNASILPVRRFVYVLILIPALLLAVRSYAHQAASAPPRATMPRGEKHEVRHEIDHLEDAWRDAVLKHDASEMEGLLADDYMGISAKGTLLTKEQTIANIRAGRVHLTSLEVSDHKVRFYGKTAVVTSLVEVQGANADGDVSGSLRYTHVYVSDAQGRWKIVSSEASRVREPAEHK